MSYVWTKNGVPISEEGSCFAPIQLSDAGAYQIIVSNAFGIATGGVFGLSMITATTNPVPVIVTALASPTNGGTVGGAGSYPVGSGVTLLASPNPNYKFVNWTVASNLLGRARQVVDHVVGTDPFYTSFVTSNLSFTAHFAPVQEQITTLCSPPRAGSASGGGDIPYGSRATVKASPAFGYLFSNWTSNGTVVSLSSSYEFTVSTNETLTANFVTNAFLAAQGNYYGLFAPTNAAREQSNSGAIKLTVGGSGVLSGKLTIGAAAPSLGGRFNPAGAATIVTPRKGETSLTTVLQLDFAGQSATGVVTDGNFVAQVLADRDDFSVSQKAADYDGEYTFIIPGVTDPTAGPMGTSFGTVTVSPLGAVNFAVSLADGVESPVNPSSLVSKEGYWPFYLPLYHGAGSLWGWNCFTNNGIVSAPFTSWINPTNPAKGAVYPSGFTNPQAAIIGSRYTPTNKPLLSLTHARVILEGGDLPISVTNQAEWASNNTITIPVNIPANTNGLKLTITTAGAKTGLIGGSFSNPANAKESFTINGVLLQDQTNAQGYFLGTNASGTFLLVPQ